MREVLLAPPVRRWHCPACGRTSTTTEVEPHAQLHPCRAARGLLTPYVPAGVAGKVTVIERQDYEQHSGLTRGVRENLRRDDAGRPAMGVSVEYDGGAAHVLFVPGIEIKARLI